MSKRLLIIYDSYNGHFSYRIRGMYMVPALESYGWTVSTIDVRKTVTKDVFDLAKDQDVLYFLKVNSLPLISELKEKYGHKIVFDLNDPLWMDHFKNDGWLYVNEILSVSDAVFCCNHFDYEYSLKFNKNTKIIPSYANVSRFDELQRAKTISDQIVIGWVGSHSTSPCLSRLSNVFLRLSRVHKIEIHIVGCNDSSVLGFSPNIKTKIFSDGYDETTMINRIFQMDIGLFPMTKTEEDFIYRGFLKPLNYMAAKIPSICYAAGESTIIIKNGDNGFLAKTEDEWYTQLELLITNRELRIRSGLLGYFTVKTSFSKQEVEKLLNISLSEVLQC